MKPTEAQINLLYRWYQWRLPTDLARDAVKWLGEHATRKAVSTEIKRAHDLYYEHRLDKDTCFESSIWDGYRVKREEG